MDAHAQHRIVIKNLILIILIILNFSDYIKSLLTRRIAWNFLNLLEKDTAYVLINRD